MVRLPLRPGAETSARSHAARRSVGLLLIAAAMTACAKNPVTGNRELVFMSERQEIETGREADAVIRTEMGVYDDPALQQYVEEVAQAIAGVSHRPELPWTFTVVDSPVVNAFALPGGFIYLTRGLMAYLNDEAELAGVLGHEIGHVTARHAVQAYSRAAGAQVGLILGQIFVPGMRPQYGRPDMTGAAAQGLGVLFLKFGRDDERQADRLGAEYASGSGWHPRGVAGMLTTLGRIADTTDRQGTPNWLATHPEPLDRVAGVAETVDSLLAETPDPATLRIAREDYLRRIDGMIYGDSPEDGFVRGRAFAHPILRIAFTAPPGFRLRNAPEAVVGTHPSGATVRFDEARLANPSISTWHYLRGIWASKVALTRIERTHVDGMDAVAASTRVRTRSGVRDVRLVAIRAAPNRVYRFFFVTPPRQTREFSTPFRQMIASFRRLGVAQAANLRPLRLRVVEVRSGDTVESLAARMPFNDFRTERFQVLNGLGPRERLQPGQLVKIVTE